MQPLIIHNKMPVIFCHIYNITLVNYPHDITGSHAKIPSITMIYILISKPFPPKQTLLTLANSHFSDITRPSRNKRPGWAWKRATSIAFRRQIRWFMDVYDRHVHTLTKLWWVDWPILQPGRPSCMLVFLPVQIRYLRCWELYRMSLAETSWKLPVRPTKQIPKGCSWFAGNLVLSQWFRRTAGQLVTGYTLETVNSVPCFAAWQCCIRK